MLARFVAMLCLVLSICACCNDNTHSLSKSVTILGGHVEHRDGIGSDIVAISLSGITMNASLARTISESNTLRRARFRKCNFSHECLEIIASSLQLQSLAIDDCATPSDWTWAARMPLLEQLDVSSIDANDSFIFAVNHMPKLQSLRVSKSTLHDSLLLPSLATRITQLDLSMSIGIGCNLSRQLAQCRSLRRIDMSYSDWRDMSQISEMIALNTIVLDGVHVNANNIRSLCSTPHGVAVSLKHAEYNTDLSRIKCSRSNIKVLALSYSNVDNVLSCGMIGASSLSSLDVEGCNHINEIVEQLLIGSRQTLRVVNLKSTEISGNPDALLMFPNLTVVYTSPSAIDDMCLQLLHSSNPKLAIRNDEHVDF